MSYPIADGAEILISAETVINFHALAGARAYLKTSSGSDNAKLLTSAATVFNFHALAYAVASELMIAFRNGICRQSKQSG